MMFESTTLGEFVKVQGGFAYKSKDFQSEDGRPVLKIKNVRFGNVDYAETAHISDELAEQTEAWATQEGDILISMTGSGPNAPQSLVGRVARIWKDEPQAWINQRVGRIVVKPETLHPDFIFYLLTLPQSQDFLVSNSTGSANQANISGKTIELLPCPSLDFKESEQIAAIVRGFDEKIILNRQTNQTLENMAQAIFKSWFVDFDPVIDNALAAGNDIPEPLQARAEQRKALRDAFEKQDMCVDSSEKKEPAPLPEAIRQLFPDGFVFDAEMGWIPEGWEVKPVGKVIENVGGGTPRTKEDAFWVGGTHPFCTPKDMSLLTSKTLVETERHLTEAGVAKISSGQLPVGTVLMSSRAPIGYLAITDVPVSVNQGIIAMKPNDLFSSEYLLGWAEANMEEVVSRANGSTFLEISKKNFRDIPFLMPDAAVLNQFDDIAKPFYQRTVSIQKNVNQLAKLRDTLLPKLISGELRIPEAQQQAETAVA